MGISLGTELGISLGSSRDIQISQGFRHFSRCGGDTIRASALDASVRRETTRDATYVKCVIDDTDIYGQLERLLEIKLPSQDDATVKLSSAHTVMLAIIIPARLTTQHPGLGHPYSDGSTRAALVVDVRDMECVVARVEKNRKSIAFIDRAKIMELDFARGVPDEN
ncbi:hypothetical protein BT96DRAFT_938108 [Gymnopus androsaceus JB14]|uniref:Uncharacterized protein n=1 Tax=Gymnopus androsaceus JB14 TaxID=1447944 RepID=A0A6A4HV27_9AGAR|nr:hypothetical protein BT96DRAFT_938108 [Gymnopus androsaceus JB14]